MMDIKKKVHKLEYYRWVVWGTLFLIFPVVHLQRQALGVVREELVGAFGLTSVAFASIGSIYFYVYAFMQIPAGLLADTLGVRLTVTIGMVLAGTGSVLFGLAPNIYALYIGRFLVGLGVSVVFVSIMKAQAQWFRESEFGTLTGLTGFVGNVGGILAQTPLAFLVVLLTWRISFVAIGIFTLLLAIICYLLVRNNPVDMGFAPVYKPAIEHTNNVKGEKLRFKRGLKTVFGNPGTWIAFFIFLGFNSGFIVLVSIWGTSYIVDVYGLAKVEAANYILMMVVGAALGAMVIGWISDHIRRRKLPMLLFGGLNVLCWFYLVIVCGAKPPATVLMLLLFILGFSSMAFILSHAWAKEVNPIELSGTATAVVNVGGFVGAAIVPLILGLVFDKYGSVFPAVLVYKYAFMICLGFSVFAFICTFIIKESYCRNIFISS